MCGRLKKSQILICLRGSEQVNSDTGKSRIVTQHDPDRHEERDVVGKNEWGLQKQVNGQCGVRGSCRPPPRSVSPTASFLSSEPQLLQLSLPNNNVDDSQ